MNSSLNAKIAHCKSITLVDSRQLFPQSVDALPLLQISHTKFSALIALQGAQLLSFQPKDAKPWLWLSPLEQFKTGHAIRGGIPICLPWFGVHSSDATKSKHGFARNNTWQLSDCSENSDSISLSFEFSYLSEGRSPLFPQPFKSRLTMTLSQQLELELQLCNHGAQAQLFSWAWHSYFACEDITAASIIGLEQRYYLDNTQALSSTLQIGSIDFQGEVDRVFQQCPTRQYLPQQGLSISGVNCPSCIVWNPGPDVAAQLADVQQGYRDFLCLERGAAFADSKLLAPQATMRSSMTITADQDD